jgi:hypothetical protein
VQPGAEIWATAKTEKTIKNAIGLVTPSPSSDISYSTALLAVGFSLQAGKNWVQPRLPSCKGAHIEVSFYSIYTCWKHCALACVEP